MPREFQRTDRVADAVQREVAKILQREMSDPRISMVTITSVEVSKDLSYAKIYVTVLGDSQKTTEAINALKGASGRIRSLLAKAIKLRIVPELRFIYDESIIQGQRLSQLINKATENDERIKKHQQDQSDDE